MPDWIECPACRRRLQVPAATIGEMVECIACKHAFRAGTDSPTGAVPDPTEQDDATEPAAPFAGDDLAASQAGAATLADWKMVRLGITLILTAHLLPFAIGLLIAGIGIASTTSPDLAMIVGLAVLLVLGCLGLRIVGQILCLRAPALHGAKGLAIASVAMFVLSLSLGCVASGATGVEWLLDTKSSAIRREGLESGNVTVTIAQTIGLVEMLVFLLFLRAVAVNLGDQRLLTTIRQMLLRAGASVPLIVMAAILMLVSRMDLEHDTTQSAGTLAMSCACFAVVFLLILSLCFLVALFLTRAALTRYILVRGGWDPMDSPLDEL